MARRRKQEDTSSLSGGQLREAMENCRDELVARIRKGYGDPANHAKIEHLRERVDKFQQQDRDMWREVAAERPRDPEVEL